MKKENPARMLPLRKLKLHRETLVRLDPSALEQAAGGRPNNSEDLESCSSRFGC